MKRIGYIGMIEPDHDPGCRCNRCNVRHLAYVRLTLIAAIPHLRGLIREEAMKVVTTSYGGADRWIGMHGICPPREEGSTCEWTIDGGEGYWGTSCGRAFRLDDGIPVENHMRYCCFCGQKLVAVSPEVNND